jgi:hypothetical protein
MRSSFVLYAVKDSSTLPIDREKAVPARTVEAARLTPQAMLATATTSGVRSDE